MHIFLPENGGRNSTIDVVRREGRRPDADEMMALRIILLIVTFLSTFKDAFQVRRFLLHENIVEKVLLPSSSSAFVSFTKAFLYTKYNVNCARLFQYHMKTPCIIKYRYICVQYLRLTYCIFVVKSKLHCLQSTLFMKLEVLVAHTRNTSMQAKPLALIYQRCNYIFGT